MEKIHIEITMLASLKTVWECFTKDKHIKNWYFATNDWKCTKAVNNFKVGGDFNYRMEIKNRSFGFDFKGTFDGKQNLLSWKTGEAINLKNFDLQKSADGQNFETISTITAKVPKKLSRFILF